MNAPTKSKRSSKKAVAANSDLGRFYAKGDEEGWPRAAFTRDEVVDSIREDRDGAHEPG